MDVKMTFLSLFFLIKKNPKIHNSPRGKASSITTSLTWSMIPRMATGGSYKQAGPAEVQVRRWDEG